MVILGGIRLQDANFARWGEFLLDIRPFYGMGLPMNQKNTHPGIHQFKKRAEEAMQDSRPIRPRTISMFPFDRLRALSK